MYKLNPKKCYQCNKEFLANAPFRKYCGAECTHKSRKGRIPWNRGRNFFWKNRPLKNKECPVCKKVFRPSSSITKFCGWQCAIKLRPHKGKMISCAVCGKKVYRMKNELNTKRSFCSRNCYKKFDRGGKITKICKKCNKEYNVHKSQVYWRGSNFCSKVCANTLIRKSKEESSYKKRLWLIFSKYIRQRDKGRCISCGKIDDWRKMDAGHYIPRSLGLATYFDEKNVNCQCTRCNRFMHGNLSQYALALKVKYGDTILEELEWKRQEGIKGNIRFGEFEFMEMIKIYKKKLEKLQ